MAKPIWVSRIRNIQLSLFENLSRKKQKYWMFRIQRKFDHKGRSNVDQMDFPPESLDILRVLIQEGRDYMTRKKLGYNFKTKVYK
jgi:hypothetical protein